MTADVRHCALAAAVALLLAGCGTAGNGLSPCWRPRHSGLVQVASCTPATHDQLADANPRRSLAERDLRDFGEQQAS